MQQKSWIHLHRIRKYSHHMGFVKNSKIFGILPNLFMNKDSLINPELEPKEISLIILDIKEQCITTHLFLFICLSQMLYFSVLLYLIFLISTVDVASCVIVSNSERVISKLLLNSSQVYYTLFCKNTLRKRYESISYPLSCGLNSREDLVH